MTTLSGFLIRLSHWIRRHALIVNFNEFDGSFRESHDKEGTACEIRKSKGFEVPWKEGHSMIKGSMLCQSSDRCQDKNLRVFLEGSEPFFCPFFDRQYSYKGRPWTERDACIQRVQPFGHMKP